MCPYKWPFDKDSEENVLDLLTIKSHLSQNKKTMNRCGWTLNRYLAEFRCDDSTCNHLWSQESDVVYVMFISCPRCARLTKASKIVSQFKWVLSKFQLIQWEKWRSFITVYFLVFHSRHDTFDQWSDTVSWEQQTFVNLIKSSTWKNFYLVCPFLKTMNNEDYGRC